MPELPEVESYARTFAEHGLRKAIRGVRVLDERILGTRRDAFVEALRGRKFVRVRRHGKHLFADAGAVWLHLHFGMSGDLSAYRDPEPEPRFARVIFDFASGRHLAFEDMRLFGVAELTPTPEAFIAEHRLGPDPLDAGFNLSTFRELLANRRGAIKSLLMSQEILAGVGNLYADEALFQASVDPRRPVPRLSSADVRAIHTRLRAILSVAVERRARGAELPPAWLYHHRETGERCPKCGGTIRRTVVFGRTTYFCATHQRR
jgi:formamidopyrimidine-DNA glycosylase